MRTLAYGAILIWTVASVAAQEPSRPVFEVASVKPNTSGDMSWRSTPGPGGSYNATNVTVPVLIRYAYDIQDFQFAGGPGWIQTERFDIAARAGREASIAEMRLMMRALLADRFKLTLRNEQRQMPQYALLLARSDGRTGPDLRRMADDCDTPAARAAAKAKERPPVTRQPGGSLMSSSCGSIPTLARGLSGAVGSPVVDKTGLAGKWDFTLYYRPDDLRAADTNLPSLFDALQEQLGLKLERSEGPVEVLVIDSVERPTPD